MYYEDVTWEVLGGLFTGDFCIVAWAWRSGHRELRRAALMLL